MIQCRVECFGIKIQGLSKFRRKAFHGLAHGFFLRLMDLRKKRIRKFSAFFGETQITFPPFAGDRGKCDITVIAAFLDDGVDRGKRQQPVIVQFALYFRIVAIELRNPLV